MCPLKVSMFVIDIIESEILFRYVVVNDMNIV